MYTIIGLGHAGCNIAEMFETDPEYKVKLIDTDIEGENCFSLEVQKTPEEYEKNVPDLSNFFQDTTEKIVMIIGGSGKISGASLQILKQLKEKEISILYIRPDIELLSSAAKLQERVTFNVLQEYARSGIFKNIFIVNNSIIENIVGDISIMEYYETLNKVIYNSFGGFLKFAAQIPIIDNSVQPKEISRIATLGVYDLETNNEKLFYPFELIDDKCYFFAIKENDLKTNGKLFKIIKDRMKEKTLDSVKISYRIHSTAHEQNYCYVVAYSRKIQQ